jgi:hypothetical protein
MQWFRDMTYASLQKVWDRNWAFITQDPSASYSAPLWIGEFGTNTNNPKALWKTEPGNQATWFNYFLRYLRDNPEVGWSFFALNGSNSNDHGAHNGLLNLQWDGPANDRLVHDLHGIQ